MSREAAHASLAVGQRLCFSTSGTCNLDMSMHGSDGPACSSSGMCCSPFAELGVFFAVHAFTKLIFSCS